MRRVLLTWAISAVGVGVFMAADLPLPWLLGPIAACLAAGLAGVELGALKPLNDAMRAILGVAIGASLSLSVVLGMPALWPTLVMIPLLILLSGLIGLPYFQRLWGFDFATSYYSAMPGGLQDMLAFGEEAGADVRALSLIHATRVMVIVVSLPFLLEGVWGVDLSNPPGAPATEIAPGQLALMVLSGLIGWRVAKAVGLFGASILGPMIAAGALSIAGVLEHRPPAEAIWAAQFFIGMTVGSKYSGVTGAEVRRDVAAAMGYCVVLIALAALFALVAIGLGAAPAIEGLLAFAPGGQAEMTVLALIAGADVAFVVTHHILRIVTVIIGAPLAARLMRARPPD
ncbi:AbrB family transcriptional regulator [Pontivivens ytuae]|uniref:AbrB family transcriptional regulator n=1 Tax=Pontivivens ytuae TaxID=2789856 RepID=A0A7S9QCQ0_9RHOB|nr:AbrB family transcriptional regulator [Pontivivens ytuae]QPH53331.1 AbrB family transcriptional regulator [Pontivivens ytuae]